MQEVPICSQLLLVGHLLLTINSSVNFLIYYLGNCRKIAQIILRLFEQRRNLRERPSFSEQQSLSTHITETGRRDSIVSGWRHRRGGSKERESRDSLLVPHMDGRKSWRESVKTRKQITYLVIYLEMAKNNKFSFLLSIYQLYDIFLLLHFQFLVSFKFKFLCLVKSLLIP